MPTPPTDYPRIIAHRCGGVLAAENSLAGLNAAAAIGCRGVEFDVMLSADGHPVLMHDETVDRTTGGRGRVAELTLAALRELDLGGEPVPTLEEALATCERFGLWANVEIKPSTGCEEATGTVVGERLARCWNRQGVVSSFSPVALAAARAQAPDLACAMLGERLPSNWPELTRHLGLVAWHLSADAAPGSLQAPLAAGLVVACYTVDAPAAAQRLFDIGVGAVFSDRPDRWPCRQM